MSTKSLSEIEESIESLNLSDQVRLLQYLAPKIADAVLSSRGDVAAAGEQAWQHFDEVGRRLEQTSHPSAPSLTEAVTESRR